MFSLIVNIVLNIKYDFNVFNLLEKSQNTTFRNFSFGTFFRHKVFEQIIKHYTFLPTFFGNKSNYAALPPSSLSLSASIRKNET
jgi:hypothetical protein